VYTLFGGIMAETGMIYLTIGFFGGGWYGYLIGKGYI